MAAMRFDVRPLVTVLTGLVGLVGLGLISGCITGERPTLAEAPLETGDAAVDAVLTRLESGAAATFTASYDVLTRFGDLRSSATVAQEGATRRSITIAAGGTFRFVVDGEATATCDLTAGTCTDTLDPQRVSDTQLAPDFYAAGAAARLRRDAGQRTGPTAAAAETIAGQPATCVTIPVGGAGGQLTSTYCALDAGPLARLDAADVAIDLTTWSPTPDPAAFARPG
ncbi:hypothetical protein BH18ACT2_BH18ACT2_17590 [soil metagenome]